MLYRSKKESFNLYSQPVLLEPTADSSVLLLFSESSSLRQSSPQISLSAALRGSSNYAGVEMTTANLKVYFES